MNMTSKYNSNYQPEESLISHRDSSSIICQLPIAYKEYQEIKENTNRNPSRGKVTAQSLNNLRLNLDSDMTLPSGIKSNRVGEMTTPIFNMTKLNYRGDRTIPRTVTNAESSDVHYKKRLDMTLQQIEKLQEFKDRAWRQIDHYQLIEVEVERNSKRCLNEFADRYKYAVRQLEIYYQTNCNKIKESEREKREYLKQKQSDCQSSAQHALKKISELENKLKSDPPGNFIQDFDKKFSEIEHFLSQNAIEKVPGNEWRDFAIPSFDVNIQAPSAIGTEGRPTVSVENVSIPGSMALMDEIEPISLNRKTNNVLSPEALASENNSPARNQREKILLPLEQMAKVKGDSYSNLKKNKRDMIEEYFNLDKTRCKSEERSKKPKNLAGTYYLPGEYNSRGKTSQRVRTEMDEFDNLKTDRTHDLARSVNRERLTEKERALHSARDIENPEIKYEKKKRHYKDKIYKLEHETKEKDRIIKTMMKSFKDLQTKYYKESSVEKIKTHVNELYGENIPSHPNIPIKKREKSPIGTNKLADDNYFSKKLLDTSTEEEIKPKREVSRESKENFYESKKKRYKFLRGKEKKPDENSDHLNQTSKKEREPSHNNEKNKRHHEENERGDRKKVNKIKISPLCIDDPSNIARQEASEYWSNENENQKNLKVYIAFEQQPSTNYFNAAILRNSTVKELLDAILAHLGIDEMKHHRYYMCIKLHEDSNEKTLLSSNKVWSYLESSQEKKSKKWPKFYLRTYNDKYAQPDAKLYR